jgi:hypothetical protein
MEQKGLRTGHIVALAGAVAALASLWRPWYSISVPQHLRDALSGGQLGQDPGLLGQMARSLASALPSRISASGWAELGGADVALAVSALAVAALVVAAAGAFGSAVNVDSAAAARGIAVLGTAALVLALVHVVHRPADHDIVKVADGLWIAVAGCVAMVVGGLMAGSSAAERNVAQPPSPGAGTFASSFPPLESELTPVFAPAPGTAAASVPPPSA